MIAKISRGRDGRAGGKGFGGVTRYVMGDRPERDVDRRPEIIGGNMAGRDPEALAREFAAVRAQRPEVEKPVHHVALSFDPRDRRLTDAEMTRVAERYLQRNGFDLGQTQYVVVRHHDKDYQHCHVVANRVRLDGALTRRPDWEFRHSRNQCRELEKELRLLPPRTRSAERVLDHAPTRGEDRMRLDRGLDSEKARLRRAIRESAHDRPNMTEFLRRLEARRIQVRPNMGRTGHPTGLSYRLDKVAVQGRRLGPAYSWRGVQTHLGVRYDERRDRPSLERAAWSTRGREPERALPVRVPRAPSRSPSRDPMVVASRVRALVRNPVRALGQEAVRAGRSMAERTNPLVRDLSSLARTGTDLVRLARTPTVGAAAQLVLDSAARLVPGTAVLAKVATLARSIAGEASRVPECTMTR